MLVWIFLRIIPRCSGNDLELLPAGQHCITHPNVTLRGLYTLASPLALRLFGIEGVEAVFAGRTLSP